MLPKDRTTPHVSPAPLPEVTLVARPKATPASKASGPSAFKLPASATEDVPRSISRKRSALAQPVEETPTAPKLARTSKASLAPRRQASSSTLQVREVPSPSSTSPGGFAASGSTDALHARLNTFEEWLRRNHEEGQCRLEEIRQLVEMDRQGRQ